MILKSETDIKNKVYFAIVDEDYGGVYIAAKNIKEAKSIALHCEIINSYLENYIDLKIHWKRGITTNYEGELDIEQIIELGCTWRSCGSDDNCTNYNDEFEYVDDGDLGSYKCKKCGLVGQIPYANC